MPRQRQFRLVEWLIILAILGILLSMVLPMMQRAAHTERSGAMSSARASEDQLAAAGQLNTIELPDASSGGPARTTPRPSRPSQPRSGFGILIAIIVAIIIFSYLRNSLSQHRARREHP